MAGINAALEKDVHDIHGSTRRLVDKLSCMIFQVTARAFVTLPNERITPNQQLMRRFATGHK